MRTGVSISVSAADRRRLEAIVADRNAAQKHVWRARIVLLTADGLGTNGIMAAIGKSKTCVWRWQERFMAAGVEGLLRDKTRPPGKAPIETARVEEVVRRTLAPPPHEATHWTARAMAEASGLAVSTVQNIWKAHGLAPHRWRSFKLSTDPAFAEKLHDIVGLYVDPPTHAVVLSVDEKSQIQALDRTQPGLPMKKGRARHHDPRLKAARHDHAVRGAQRARRHRRWPQHGPRPAPGVHPVPERSRAGIPKDKAVHAIIDNYAAHKTPEVRRWLARHPRWTFHFTPTSSSWLNAVEGFFAKLFKRRLKRGVFCSLVELQAAINRFVAEHNKTPNPSSGAPIPTRSSPPAPVGSKRWSRITSASARKRANLA